MTTRPKADAEAGEDRVGRSKCWLGAVSSDAVAVFAEATSGEYFGALAVANWHVVMTRDWQAGDVAHLFVQAFSTIDTAWAVRGVQVEKTRRGQ